METPKKGDDDDLVDTGNYQDTNNEESEGKDQRDEIKIKNQNQITQKLMKEIRDKTNNQL